MEGCLNCGFNNYLQLKSFMDVWIYIDILFMMIVNDDKIIAHYNKAIMRWGDEESCFSDEF